jgi:acyl carrier protein
MNEIYERLSEIFSEVFDEELTVSADTTSNDIEDWDSLSHITLISAIEEAFGMRFSMKEVVGMANVGELAQIISSRATK